MADDGRPLLTTPAFVSQAAAIIRLCVSVSTVKTLPTPSKRTVLVVLLVALVGFAGCSGPSDTGGDTGGEANETTEMIDAANETTEMTDAANETAGNATNASDADGVLFDGNYVNISGVSGDVFLDDQDDSIANVTILNDSQGEQPGFVDVRVYENGTVVDREGNVVGQVEVNEVSGTPGVEAGTDNSEYLFGGGVNVSSNGSVYNDNDDVIGNVSIVDDNQQGGDGFFDVNVYENGTVVNEEGDVVGEVEINEVCPTANEDGYFFDGNYVNVSGANGDVFFDNQDDSFVDLRIVDDSQGASDDGFQNVRVAANGTVVNQQGETVGQVEVSQNCPSVASN